MRTRRQQNPFRFGQVVQSEEEYSRRTQLEKRLRARVSRGQNTVVLGERRVGKTSLIWKVAQSVRGRRMWYGDFLGIKTGEDFLTRCVQAMGGLERHGTLLDHLLKALPRLSVSVSPDPVTGLPSLAPSLSGEAFRPDTLVGLFEAVRVLAAKRKLVVVFDEFQDVGGLPDAEGLLAVLRGRIQFLGETAFVFAGSVRSGMWRLFAEQDSPFFKSAEFLEVEADDFDDFRGFLRERFRAGGNRIAPEALDRVFEICDGVPGDVQQLCAALWETAPARGEIGLEGVGPALGEIFRNEVRGYESIITDLTAQQLKVLGILARLGGESVLSKEFLKATGIAHPTSIKRAMTRLISRRIVFRSGKVYRFSNPFLRMWLLHKGFG